MKRYLSLFLALIIMAFTSCQKIPGHIIGPVTPGTGNTGGGGIVVADVSKGYQPFTANSFWKYREVGGGIVDTVVNTVTGGTTTINNKVYHNVTATSVLYGFSTGYYYSGNHNFSIRATTLLAGITIDMLYLVDNVAVGAQWTAPVTDNGSINGVPARILGTIAEKGISRTVSGRTFNNVIHTTLHLQYDFGTGFSDITVYDMYIANGIGVIESNSSTSFGGGTAFTTSSVLIDYSIK